MSALTPDSVSVANERLRHGWIDCWRAMARNVWLSRELIWELFKRDFIGLYKKSWLGVFWAFISPLVGILSWVFLQKTGLLNPGDIEIPYPVYVLIGTSMWGLFMDIYSASADTLKAGESLVLQVNYPHEALLFKQMAKTIASFLISFTFVFIMLLLFRLPPDWRIVFLPAILFPVFLLAAGLGLVVALFRIVAIDLDHVFTIGMGLLLYTTPIIYSSSPENPWVEQIIFWNPLTYLVCSARDIILFGRLYDAAGYAISSLFAAVVFLIACRLFYVAEKNIVERMI